MVSGAELPPEIERRTISSAVRPLTLSRIRRAACWPFSSWHRRAALDDLGMRRSTCCRGYQRGDHQPPLILPSQAFLTAAAAGCPAAVAVCADQRWSGLGAGQMTRPQESSAGRRRRLAAAEQGA